MKRLNKAVKSILFYSILSALVFALFLLGINLWVMKGHGKSMYSEVEKTPFNQIGLVLGTSKYFSDGQENLYFNHRIKAAVDLYCSGKIKHIIVSGDNGHVSYNEPRFMYKALVEAGVPGTDITMDYAGFRTLDSVVRCKEVFQQDKVTIISQRFHNHRALFIGRHFGMNAIAFNAKKVDQGQFANFCRENLARCKAVLDLYVLNTQPRFLGDPVKIDI